MSQHTVPKWWEEQFEEKFRYWDLTSLDDLNQVIDFIKHIEGQALQQQRDEIVKQLIKQQRAVTYKTDDGHGWAVPMSEVLKLLQPKE